MYITKSINFKGRFQFYIPTINYVVIFRGGAAIFLLIFYIAPTFRLGVIDHQHNNNGSSNNCIMLYNGFDCIMLR